VDNNCDVHFSRGGCLVQDLVSGTVIVRGLKWHKKLGHSNSVVLTHLLKHGHLGIKNSFSSSPASFNCATCRLGKSKTLPFPMHGTRASLVLRLCILMFGVSVLLFLMVSIIIL